MGETTAIEWTDHTFNGWWGCSRVSPGCTNCYAETFAKRTGHAVWGKGSERRFFGDAHWAEPLKWERDAAAGDRREFVFCSSMADVFEDRADLVDPRERLWRLVGETPHLVWQLLTKRPENVLGMVPGTWLDAWPRNAWIGTTTEDQPRADERVPMLLRVPAPVRFLSAEPLLGPVRFDRDWLVPKATLCGRQPSTEQGRRTVVDVLKAAGRRLGWRGVDWVIVGGESGPRHRPVDPAWVRSIREQCAEAGVPLWFKQWGGRTPKAGGRTLDGATWSERPEPT